MHGFPQLTRSTLWREFTWVEPIIFGGNFIVRGRGGSYPRGQLSEGQFSSGAIILEGNYRGTIIQETIIRGAIFLGGNCPRTVPTPCLDIYYDQIGHWPEPVNKKNHCRLCQAYSRTKCSKCKLSLCLLKDRNCFKDFYHKWK